MSDEPIIVCTDTQGNRFACPLTVWDSFNSAEATPIYSATPQINNLSTPAPKIALFRSLFRGREDVYAKRYYSVKTGSAGYVPVCKTSGITRCVIKGHIRASDVPTAVFHH